MYVSDLDKHGIVYYAETADGGLMCGGSDESGITAVFIADTPEELQEHIDAFTEKKPVIKSTTLFSLCDDWRFFMYRNACRMVVAGDGWLSRAVGETAKWGSRLCSDPSCVVVCAKDDNDDFIRMDGGIVIAQDVADLLELVGDQVHSDSNEFIARPLITLAVPDEIVWYQGNTYRVRESLERNLYMLSKFLDVDEEAQLLRRIEDQNEN